MVVELVENLPKLTDLIALRSEHEFDPGGTREVELIELERPCG